MSLDSKLSKFFEIFRDAKRIMDSNISWETKYDLIFSDDISKAIKSTGFVINWYDPDTTYEEDVCAYYCALEEKAEELKLLQEI